MRPGKEHVREHPQVWPQVLGDPYLAIHSILIYRAAGSKVEPLPGSVDIYELEEVALEPLVTTPGIDVSSGPNEATSIAAQLDGATY